MKLPGGVNSLTHLGDFGLIAKDPCDPATFNLNYEQKGGVGSKVKCSDSQGLTLKPCR